MSIDRMPPEVRASLVERASHIEPRMSDSADIGHLADELHWRGKYADIAHRYFNGMREDTGHTGNDQVGNGVLLGYRVYATAIAQVPRVLQEFDPEYPKNNIELYSILSRSLLPALGEVLGVNAEKNTSQEIALGLRGLPFPSTRHTGFEFRSSGSGLIYAAKLDLLKYRRGEVDESEIVSTGLSYEALRRQSETAGCAMPIEFHQKIWDAMVRTCVFDYNYINADIDEIRKTLPDTNSSRVQ